jgi:serine/threonine protein kinase
LIQNKIIKLADFGMGRFLENVDKQSKLTKVGTPAYAAP